MTCIRILGGIVCLSPFYRLPLADGRRIFMDWHNYCGPIFYRDRDARREVAEWWNDPLICEALDWFTGRGNRA